MYRFKKAMRRYRNAAKQIQSNFRMKKVRIFFLVLKFSVIIIQRFTRIWLTTGRMLQFKWLEYNWQDVMRYEKSRITELQNLQLLPVDLEDDSIKLLSKPSIF